MVSKEGVDTMGTEITKDILFNRQVNYFIIEKMWKYLNKDKDKQELYDLLDINKNMYTRIRTADTYNTVNLEGRWERKNSPLQKLGLSKEIMTGLEMIEIEGIAKSEWEEYIRYRYVDTADTLDDKEVGRRTSAMQLLNRKLNETFVGLVADKRDKRDIGKLFYFFTYGRAVTLDMPDAEMVDLRNSLKHVNIENMKVCDKDLRKEVYESLREKYRQLDIIIKYEALNK